MEIREDISELLPIIEKYIRLFEAKSFLEIGCAEGNGSTVLFSRLLQEFGSVYVSVDLVDIIIPEYRPVSDKWHLVLGDSRELSTLERVREVSGDVLFDVIFIDTEHNYNVMEKELALWRELAHENTLWLFHDTWMQGTYNKMTDAIKKFVNTDRRWNYFDLSIECNGLGALLPT